MVVQVQHPIVPYMPSVMWYIGYGCLRVHLCCGMEHWELWCMGNVCSASVGGFIVLVLCQIITFPIALIALALSLTVGLVADLLMLIAWILTLGCCFQYCSLGCRAQNMAGRQKCGTEDRWEDCEGAGDVWPQMQRLDRSYSSALHKNYSPFDVCTGDYEEWPMCRCIACWPNGLSGDEGGDSSLRKSSEKSTTAGGASTSFSNKKSKDARGGVFVA
eukprot:TRINITY_DN16288_c0_g1_i1.p1 TRINITY_DN16288_c0_g1~~TRINITY_DN16288_c0_g1_i1.p1  ORF type:complete len:217 (-),score=11.25 TRINITY_DN16288_c0_g1_i1:133-783(-)